MILNLRSSENAPAYTLASNEGVIKAIVNFCQDDSDTVFLPLCHDLRPSILKVQILIGLINGWKCWTLAS